MGGGADYFLPAGSARRQAQGWQGHHRRVPRQGLPGRAQYRRAESGRGRAGCSASSPTRTWTSRSTAIPRRSRRRRRWPPPRCARCRSSSPERLRSAGGEREHRHRGAHERRRVAHARAVGVRRCGQGRARIPAAQSRYAGDRNRRPRDRRILTDLRAEGPVHPVERQPLLRGREQLRMLERITMSFGTVTREAREEARRRGSRRADREALSRIQARRRPARA